MRPFSQITLTTRFYLATGTHSLTVTVSATGLHDWSQFLLAGERRTIAGRHFDSRSAYRERL